MPTFTESDHGNGKGSISVEAYVEDGELCISVMDTGVGMDAQALDGLRQLLEGDAPGVKDEYNWRARLKKCT